MMGKRLKSEAARRGEFRILYVHKVERLARYFGTSPQFWMGLQNDYDLDVAAEALGNRLDIEVRPMTASG